MSGAAGRRAARLLGGTVARRRGGARLVAGRGAQPRAAPGDGAGAGRPAQAPLRLLHLSDLHLTPRSTGERDWVAGLAALEPDLTVVTGDMLAHREAVPTVRGRPRRTCCDRPGAFVLGSNDYHAPARRATRCATCSGRAGVAGEVRYLPTGDLVRGADRGGLGAT